MLNPRLGLSSTSMEELMSPSRSETVTNATKEPGFSFSARRIEPEINFYIVCFLNIFLLIDEKAQSAKYVS